METIFKLKDDDLQKLVDSIMKIPDLAESIMNDYLHNHGANIVIDKITERMPVGVNNNKKYKGYPRTHAKYSLSLTFTKMNLGFAIKTSRSPFFGYLYFPAFGEGTSKHNAPNLFFEEGAESAREPIVDELAKLLEEKIKEGLSNGK